MRKHCCSFYPSAPLYNTAFKIISTFNHSEREEDIYISTNFMKIRKQVEEGNPNLWLQRGKGRQNCVAMCYIWQQWIGQLQVCYSRVICTCRAPNKQLFFGKEKKWWRDNRLDNQRGIVVQGKNPQIIRTTSFNRFINYEKPSPA